MSNNLGGTPERRVVYAWEGEVDALNAEIERLRAALQQIAGLDDDYHSARTAVILATDALTAAKGT